MLTENTRRALIVATSMALAACGGGSGSGGTAAASPGCTTISGGGTTTSFDSDTCLNCSASNRDQAVDGNLDTFGTLTIPAGSAGSPSLRANAQDGIVFPAGNVAAVVLSAGPANSRIHVLTFLDGVPQDNGVGRSTATTRDGIVTVAIETTQAFNSVEFQFDADAGVQESAMIREFCSSSDSPVF